MYSTYILKLSNGSYYTGSTGNLEQRLTEHQNGKVKSTKNNLPCQLIYSETYQNRSLAQGREYQIKKWKSRAAIERLLKK
ncbi:MAG: GIY-YIG nuclease family protein [Patescibacteria group bacterium]